MGIVLGSLAGLEIAELAGSAIGAGIEIASGSEAAGAAISGGIAALDAGTIGEASTGISEAISGLISGGTEVAEIEAVTESLATIGIDNTALLQGLDIEALSMLTEDEFALLLEQASQTALEGEQAGLSTPVIDFIKSIRSKVSLDAIKSIIKKVIKGAITAEIGNQIITGLVREFSGKTDKELDGIVVIDDNGNLIVDPSSILKDPFKFGTKVADITSVMVQQVGEDIKKNPNRATDETFIETLIKKSFNGLRNLGDRVVGKSIVGLINTSEFFNSPEQEKKFNEIWKVYNGKGIKVWEHEGKFYFQDETSKVYSYNGAVNEKSVTTAEGYVWLGPKSFNNALPVNLLDTIAFMHDTDYDTDGYFNPIADMKFVSRCLQNLSRMGPTEASLALSSSVWFQSAGHVLSTYVHPHVATFTAVKDKFIEDDLYSAIIPRGKKVDEATRKHSQEEFYEGIKDGMDKNFAIVIGAKGASKQKDSFETIHFNSMILNLRIVSVC